jgi:hypothetical protein
VNLELADLLTFFEVAADVTEVTLDFLYLWTGETEVEDLISTFLEVAEAPVEVYLTFLSVVLDDKDVPLT